jgi:serine/threonine protein kinase
VLALIDAQFFHGPANTQDAFLLLPYCPRGSLQKMIEAAEENGRAAFTEVQCLRIFFELCMGVLALHQKGYSHRDIKVCTPGIFCYSHRTTPAIRTTLHLLFAPHFTCYSHHATPAIRTTLHLLFAPHYPCSELTFLAVVSRCRPLLPLQPANVLCTSTNPLEPKLTDFGSAAAAKVQYTIQYTILTIHYTYYALYSAYTTLTIHSLCTALTMHCTHHALYSYTIMQVHITCRQDAMMLQDTAAVFSSAPYRAPELHHVSQVQYSMHYPLYSMHYALYSLCTMSRRYT